MSIQKAQKSGHSFWSAAACVLACTLTMAYFSAAPAQQTRANEAAAAAAPSQLSADDLERAFWLCDYIATERGVDSSPVALCTAVFDEVKNARFGGDFAALLDWWRLNKAVEHVKLSA